jgi:hypothetical protein
MSLGGSADGALAGLSCQERLILLIREAVPAELILPLDLTEAFPTSIRPALQLRELIDGLLFAAPITSCLTVPDSSVLDLMQSLLDQLLTDGHEGEACSARDFSYRQTIFVKSPNRIH